MMSKKILLVSLLIYSVLFPGCEEKSDPTFDQENFTKIYDTNQFSQLYDPIDIQQTPDGGYIILAGRKLDDSNFSGIYLLKADKYGNFVTDMEVDGAYVNPIAGLMPLNNSYYFFCMEGLNTRIAQIDPTLATFQVASIASDLSYPAAASLDDTNFLLLSYDNENRQSVVSSITPEGAIINSKRFDIEPSDEIEEPIINHFIRTGHKFPMQVGRIPNGLYFFNGFFDYTFSLVFTNLSDDNATSGIVQGQQNDGGMSAILPLGNNEFAAARFNYGDNYFLSNTALSTGEVSSSTDLEGNPLVELVPNAKVKIIKATINNKKVLIYASDTKSKQIGLYFYDETTGTFISSKYLGFSNSFEVAGLIQTTDNGLAICGTTYLAGRFPRICIFKISEKELKGNVNP
jgi:hypothetical protein